jgi:septum formation protein
MRELPRVILASQSPRRQELLKLIGIPHEVMPANLDESYLDGETPVAHVERLARAKASTIIVPDAVVIGSDTIVVVDGKVLGKPVDDADAERMLRVLSGRAHVVMTAVAVAWKGSVQASVEEVSVTFHALTDAAIRSYVATREPMDKAGAYGIQGYGATLVKRVDGDYFAVMGLPLQRMVRVMEQMGLLYRFGPVEVP